MSKLQVYEDDEGFLREISSPFCGSGIQQEISTMNNSMVIEFRSNISTNGSSFKGTFKAVENGI